MPPAPRIAPSKPEALPRLNPLHESLGEMLGVRRASVSLSAQLRQGAGLIRYSRGQITVLDQAGLHNTA